MAIDQQVAHNLNSSLRRLARALGFAKTDRRKLKSAVTVANKIIKAEFSNFDAEKLTVKEFEHLRAVVSESLTAVLSKSLNKIADDILALGENEVLFNIRLLTNESVKEIKAPARFDSSLKNTPVDGIPYTDTYKRFLDSADNLYRDTLTSAYYSGITKEQLNDALDAVADTIKTRGETLIRTLVNHTSNIAKNEVYEANKDIIEEVEFKATLDQRTTLTCAKFDGMRFSVGSKHPQPPLHYNCRSILVPIVKDEFVPKRYKDIADERASYGSSGRKPVSSELTFTEWFSAQSEEWQQDYLGEERYKLYKTGKYPITRFTDDLGRPLTLQELGAIM